MYDSTLSLTSALNGVGDQRHASVAIPLGKIWCLLCRMLTRSWYDYINEVPIGGLQVVDRVVLTWLATETNGKFV